MAAAISLDQQSQQVNQEQQTGYADDGRPFNILDEFRDMPVDEIKKVVINKSLPYSVLALNIQGCLNIGNMIRTVNLCAAREFIVFGRRKYDSRGCVGAQNYINLRRIDALTDEFKRTDDENFLDEVKFIEFVKENRYLPIFVEQDKYARTVATPLIKGIIQRATGLKLQPLLIFGSESYGIPKNILDTRMQLGLSYTIELKQMGCIRSFNVANCCSIICYKMMETYEELGICSATTHLR